MAMEASKEQDGVSERGQLLKSPGDSSKQEELDKKAGDASTTPSHNNHEHQSAQSNMASSLGQDEFPTLTAAASIRKSKRGNQQQRPAIPREFHTERSPQGTNILGFPSPLPPLATSSRSWADVVKPACLDPPAQDSAREDANPAELSRPIRFPSSALASSDPEDSLSPEPKLNQESIVDPVSSIKVLPPSQQGREDIDLPTPSLGSGIASSSGQGHQRTHSFPPRCPGDSSHHIRQDSLTTKSDTTSKTTHNLWVPAIPRSFHTSSPNRPTNKLYSNSSKKSLNVDSPSFTPAQLGSKKSNFSTNAAPFTPRAAAASTNPPLQQDPGTSLFKSSPFPEFAPQNNYDLNTVVCLEMRSCRIELANSN
ncbi:hypothetical protein F5X99DRAFT_103554 [Biscogniauxia marginata]|nr:hypothetical protein F5X99DRAFT_103554 [Biscogniauxia marginata]